MALPLKGLWKDSPKSLHPQDSAFEVVNGIIRKNLKAYTNEPGCIEHSISYNNLGYKQVGIFNAKYGEKIVFSIGQDNKSKIGIIKADGTYEERLSEYLGFDENFPIDCESYYNYKGELNIAFTDYNMTPKLVNLDDIKMPFNINDIQLFSFFKQPQVTPTIEEAGGSLKTGAWFPFFAFKDSTSITPYTAVGNPIFINRENISQGLRNYDGDPAGSPSSKSIKLTLNNIDTNYETLIVGFVSKIGGVLEARIIKEVPITGESMVTFFTGGESSTLISLQQLLTSSSVYNKIKHFTQIDGVLYGAGTAESSPLNFQKYANLIRLKYTIRQIHYNAGGFAGNTREDSYKLNEQNNLFKGWASGEVYAFYIKLKIKGRGLSDAFLISGRPPEGNETAYFSTLGAGYDVQKAISSTAKKYQIDETAGINGKFGYWENEDEYYPNTDDFAPVNGSEDLRGKRVRHHRFPSIDRMRELGLDFSSIIGVYGISWMNALGIEVESFPTLPPEVADQIEGYQIFYAKRSADNSTVNGQSLVMFNSWNSFDTNDTRQLWSGGNWGVKSNFRPPVGGGDTWRDFLDLNTSSIRLNSFDLMLDKPVINPTYLTAQVKLKTNVAGHFITYKKGRYFIHLDYVQVDRTQSIPITADDKIKKINSFRYLPANTNADNYVNIIGEETAVAKVEGSYSIGSGFLRTGLFTDTVNTDLVYEETYLVNLMAYKTNLYNSYFLQELVSTNRFVKLTDTDKKIWGGDINIVMDSYVTVAPATPQQLADPTAQNPALGDIGEHDNIDWATKVVRGFLKESINNASLRHEVDGDELTKYYPKQDIGPDIAWFKQYPRTWNPNKIAYNKDYSSVGDLNPSVISTGERTFVEEDPYKIIRSRIPSAEDKDVSWKVFLANDYYIVPKDKGFITNIQGVGKDLFINCEFTLLKTQGAEELATDSFKVVLGTGNIFERPPVELILDEEGYAGCQHKFSCLLTRYGYFFVDEDRKKVFLANSTVKDITAGLQNFFRDELKTSGDNPYREKGYTSAWDDEFSRIILSSKEAGFTRSYDPDMESWISRHTYLPNQLIGDRNSLFALNDGKLYKHNIPTVRGIYYNSNVIDPFIVVFIARDEQRQISLANIQWSTNVLLGENNLKDLTFNSVLAWNSYQSTDVLPVVPFNKEVSLEQNFDTTNTRRIKNIWNFNSIKDVLKIDNQQFINDITLMDDVIDNDRPFYLKKMLSDDYVAIKLLFSNQKIGTLQAEIQLLNFGVNGNIVAR